MKGFTINRPRGVIAARLLGKPTAQTFPVPSAAVRRGVRADGVEGDHAARLNAGHWNDGGSMACSNPFQWMPSRGSS